MQNLIIEKTDNTPGIVLSSTDKLIEISGESRPENAKLFFDPIFKWLTDYCNHLYYIGNQSNVIVTVTTNFKLEYFNSSSAKFFTDLIKLLHKAETDGKHLLMDFNWFYEVDDEDLKYAGEEFIKMTGIKMKLVSY